jgi:hypothetical protein
VQTGGQNLDCDDLGLVRVWKDETGRCENGPTNGIAWVGKDVSSPHDSDDVVCETEGDYTYDNNCNGDAETLYSFSSTTPIRAFIIKASNQSKVFELPNATSFFELSPGYTGVTKDSNNNSNCDKYEISHVDFCACPSN